MSFDYLRDGHPVRVTIDRRGESVRAEIGERELWLHSPHVDERQIRLVTTDGRHHRLVYARRDGRIYVAARAASLELAEQADVSGEDEAGAGGFTPEVVAPMPGKILAVLVAVGDNVTHDTPLLRMEAMKMEQTIRAPAAAKVRELRVEAGAMVGPGAVLLVLDPVPEP
jgi:3-methylcrotonyl-CoA carboxylase alpha subunit